VSRSPTFSVVIPTYNRLSSLKQALSSVWAQTYGDYELIVVDDGSADGTADYLAAISGYVEALHQPNGGPAAARNLGVRHATGNYIAFLDSDDLWPTWTLATFHKLVQKYQPALICGRVREFSDVVPSLTEGSLYAEQFTDYLDTAREPRFVASCALVVNRSTFERAGGFDESLAVAEDHDFFFRVGTVPGYVRVHSPITTLYRRHPQNTSRLLSVACASAIAILNKEAEGCYPGGKERQLQRWQLLSRVIRPIVWAGANAGLGTQSWSLYARSFRMNVRVGRWSFLVAFPFHAVFGTGSRLPPNVPSRSAASRLPQSPVIDD
jgi:glycosyltransferase involved in cell wall biosynthesis